MALRTFEVTREKADGRKTGLVLDITYEFYPGCKATRWEPAVGDEFYLNSVVLLKGNRRRTVRLECASIDVYDEFYAYIQQHIEGGC